MGEKPPIRDVISDVKKRSTPRSPRNDNPGSHDQCQQASDRPWQSERHLEVKVVPPGTIPRETGQSELHQEVKVGPPGTIPRETGGKVEWCTECVKKGYTPHRCCDDVPGISRGPHQQASS